MAKFTLTINDDQLAYYLAGVARLHPIPTDSNGTPLYTPAQWAKERLKRHVIDTIWNQKNYEAKLAVSVVRDDAAVTVA